MSEGNGSKYGKGFAMRMIVLVGLLALVASGLYYDRVILKAKAENTIKEAYKLMVAPDEDGHGITKNQVQKTIGFAPESETTADVYEIERYSFKRALPFMESDYLNVIYENGALVNMLRNKEYSPESVKDNLGFRSAADANFKGNKVELGGVPTSSLPGADSDDDEDADDDDAADDDDGDEADDDGEAADDDGDDEEEGDADADEEKEDKSDSADKDDEEKSESTDEDATEKKDDDN